MGAIKLQVDYHYCRPRPKLQITANQTTDTITIKSVHSNKSHPGHIMWTMTFGNRQANEHWVGLTSEVQM